LVEGTVAWNRGSSRMLFGKFDVVCGPDLKKKRLAGHPEGRPAMTDQAINRVMLDIGRRAKRRDQAIFIGLRSANLVEWYGDFYGLYGVRAVPSRRAFFPDSDPGGPSKPHLSPAGAVRRHPS